MSELTGASQTIEEVVAVARHLAPVAPLAPEVRARMEASRAWVEASVRSDALAI